MAGRPRKPIAKVAADGDTRKLGAHKHQERIEKAFIARRGYPPSPPSLVEVELSKESSDKEVACEIRRENARAHYEYICQQLEADGLLCPADNGMLEGMAMNYAMQRACFEAGAVKEFDILQRAYMQAANLVGLNESARAKIPKPDKPQLSNADLGLAAGLPDDDQASIQ